MGKRYEVQTWTLCGDWINTWSIIEEAQQALDEFLFDIQSEIDTGQRSADEGYDAEDFRIVQVAVP